MKITKLEYQKQDPNRVSVYVDDKFAVGIDANDVIKLGIYSGQELTQEDLNKIIGESEFGKLFNASLNFLSYRPRSEWEIRRKLKFKSQNSDLINKVIEKLKLIGQIDDAAFARWFTDQREVFKPKSKRMINYELKKLGVKANVTPKASDVDLAKKALGKRNLDQDRAQRFLASRGFDWDTIDEVIKKE